jgi:UDP-3-O-[3-hydroxymyristoyl] glucosamine N-acyltransferase
VVYSGKPALPIREEQKIQAFVRRLPKLVERVKALEETAGRRPAGS